jgi:hypothetical protein
VPTFEDVAALALELPEVVESTSYGTPALKVGNRGGLIARLRSEDGALVLSIDPNEREALLAERADVYYLTPHYEGAPYVLVRLEFADLAELGDLVFEAWQAVAPRRARLAREEGAGVRP